MAPEETPIAADKPQTTTPSAPKGFKVTEVTAESVSLAWDGPDSDGGAPIKGYVVVMREASKNKYKKVGNTDGATALTVTKVKPGQEYYFRVYAENEMGISEDACELEAVVKVPEVR